MENSKKPLKTYKAKELQLSVWENKTEEGDTFKKISFQRSYKDKDDNWQSTQTLRIKDLPKLNILIIKAYNDEILIE